MKKTNILFFLIAITSIWSGCSILQSGQKKSKSEGLFTDLAQAAFIGDVNWYLDGELLKHQEGEEGFILTTKRYNNFLLSLEFSPDDQINSGVFIRCQDLESISLQTAYEINIADLHENPDFRTGAIVSHTLPMQPMNTIHKWNLYEIRAEDNEITVFINGVKMGFFNNAGLGPGYIALQKRGNGHIQFKNIRIESWD